MKKKLECLTPEAISNRFLAPTDSYTAVFFKSVVASNPWIENEEAKILRYMKERGVTRAKAKKIIKDEFSAWEKEYNSPLSVANRKINELERHLELIKEVIADPNYLDRYE